MNNIHQIRPTTSHALVTYDVDLSVESDRDFDLEASLQFTNDGHSAHFDFSSYILVSEDLSDLESERQRLASEIMAVNNLVDAVSRFHAEFLTQASAGLDRLAALQASAQS